MLKAFFLSSALAAGITITVDGTTLQVTSLNIRATPDGGYAYHACALDEAQAHAPCWQGALMGGDLPRVKLQNHLQNRRTTERETLANARRKARKDGGQ